MSQHYTWLPLRGLVTNPNWRQAEGGAQASTNISWATPGVAQLRRGVATRDTGPTYTTRGLSIAPLHEDYLFTHWSDGTVRSLGDTFFSATTYAHPAGSSYGVRWARSGGRLFFTTSAGVYKIASPTASAALLPAGVWAPPAPMHSSSTNDAAFNWWANLSTSAYRALLVRKDNLSNYVVGEPSGRMVATNATGGSRYPVIRCYLPPMGTHQDTVTFQLYRSAADTAGGEPSDELGLVYETTVTAAHISAGYIDVDDVCPDALRGEALYTNARQEGIAQRRTNPPITYDLAEFGGCLWGARTTPPQTFSLQIVGINVTGGSTYLVIDGIEFLSSAVEGASSGYFLKYTAGTASQNVRYTAESLCRCINYQHTTFSTGIVARYLGDGGDGTANIEISRTSLGGSAFQVMRKISAPDAITTAPTITMSGVRSIILVGGISRAANVVSATTTGAHGLVPGDTILIALPPGGGTTLDEDRAGLPPGVKTIATTPTGTTFTYAEAGANYTNAGTVTVYEVTGGQYGTSDAKEQKNRLAFSRSDEPEAWPEENEFFVGAANEPIQRIFASRDSLWVFKGDGTWRISGYSPDTFSLSPFDSSLLLHAENSLALGDGRVFGWFTTGIYALDESGAQNISLAIQDQVDLDRPVTSSASQAHGLWDPFDNSYQLWRKKGDTTGASTGWFGHVYWPSTQAWSSYQFTNSSAEASYDVSASITTKPPTSLSLPATPTPFYLITGASGSGTSDVLSARDTHANGHLWFDLTDNLITASLGFMFAGGQPGEMRHFQSMRVLTNVTRATSTEAYAFGAIACPTAIDGSAANQYNLADGSSDSAPATATRLAVGRTQRGYTVHAPIDSRRGSACEASITIYSGGAPGGGGSDGGSNVRIEGIEIAWRATRNSKAWRGSTT